jgi:hypothetical protein
MGSSEQAIAMPAQHPAEIRHSFTDVLNVCSLRMKRVATQTVAVEDRGRIRFRFVPGVLHPAFC